MYELSVGRQKMDLSKTERKKTRSAIIAVLISEVLRSGAKKGLKKGGEGNFPRGRLSDSKRTVIAEPVIFKF